MKEEKKEMNLREATTALNKRFGEGYLSKGSKDYFDISRISTGVFSLDNAIGGGVPLGKVMTLAGEYSSGKTSVALSTASQFQKAGHKVVFIDTDGGLDLSWAKKLGVNIDEMIICQPDYIEQVSDTIETLLMSDEIGLIIFDSVANTPTKAELDETCEKDSFGGIGKPMARMMRKITKRLIHTSCSIIITNQLRDKIGSMFGATEYMPGGRALKFQSDIIVWIRPSKWIPETGDPRIGKKSNFRVTKNRTAPPLKVGGFDIYFDGHVDNNSAIIAEALKSGIVVKTGKNGWYYYEDKNKKTQSINNFISKLVKNNKIDEIRKKVLEIANE